MRALFIASCEACTRWLCWAILVFGCGGTLGGGRQVNTSFGEPFENLLQSCLEWSPLKRPSAVQVGRAPPVSLLVVPLPLRTPMIRMACMTGYLSGAAPAHAHTKPSAKLPFCASVRTYACVCTPPRIVRSAVVAQILSHPFFEPTLRNAKQTSLTHLERFLQFTGEPASTGPGRQLNPLSPHPACAPSHSPSPSPVRRAWPAVYEALGPLSATVAICSDEEAEMLGPSRLAMFDAYFAED
jgi:hypothetical protein